MTDLEQEARELARESGWPDEMYLGLMQMAKRTMDHQGIL